jgi:hypothetical protein
MTLFQMLSNDERVIVLSSEDNQQVYTWNRSLTLQCWTVQEDGTFEEVDIRTLSTEPHTYERARQQAQKWLYDNEGV